MIKNNITIEDVCNLLNELLELDYDCCYKLMNNRVECNEKIINHPTIQVHHYKTDDIAVVGILGILNGLFVISDDNCFGAICYEIDDVTKKIIKFIPTTNQYEFKMDLTRILTRIANEQKDYPNEFRLTNEELDKCR